MTISNKNKKREGNVPKSKEKSKAEGIQGLPHDKNKGKGNSIEMLPPERIARAKFAYTTRRVPRINIAGILPTKRHPHPGDLLLAKVTKIGQHEHLELPDGRRAKLRPGDEIVVTYGNRYAPDQFEAIVPDSLAPCHLIAAGGIAGQLLQKHAKMRNPTAITPIGLLGNSDGRRVNLSSWGLARITPDPSLPRPSTVVIAGTSMNSGKTSVITCLTRGLISAGCRVASAKVSGTGAGGDHWQMIDAGADPVLDFIDAGVASTYRLEIEKMNFVIETLLGHLFRSPVDMVLLEISDGLLEPETARILTSPKFKTFVDAVVFTASDALGATAGVAWLREHGLPVVAVSGLLTSSPLAMREALGAAEIPIYETDSLIKTEVASAIKECVAERVSSNKGKISKSLCKTA